MASCNSPDARPSTTTVLSSDEELAFLTAWPRRVVSPKGRSCFGGPKRLDLPAPSTTPTTLIVRRPGPRTFLAPARRPACIRHSRSSEAYLHARRRAWQKPPRPPSRRPGPRLRPVLQSILAPVPLRSSDATPRAARRSPP